MAKKGLDISEFQSGLNLQTVKNAGYEFVILRAGYTGSRDGVSKAKDSSFETFYKQAKNVGLGVGAYWFSRATSKQKGIDEANYMYNNCLKGKQFDYPIYLDVEDGTYQAKASKQAVTDGIIGFCQQMEKLGYFVGVYANANWFSTKINVSQIKAYSIWLAYWTTNKPSMSYTFKMWQNSSKGKVGGYTVDTDYAYSDFPQIIKEAGLNGYPKSTPTPTPTPTPQPQPTPVALKVGDKVKIIGYGKAQANGGGKTAGGIGWTRYIKKIYTGQPYPYQVGNGTGTTGFYKDSALKKI